MNKPLNEAKPAPEPEVTKILSFGFSLTLDLTLSLTESQCEHLNINIPKISSLTQMKDIFMSHNVVNEAIASLLFLSSPNFLINSLLYINRANKVKSFIEYLIPFSPKYEVECLFMKDIVKFVTQHNLLFIEERGLIRITPSIRLILKLLTNDYQLKEEKTFVISNECDDESDSNPSCGFLFNSLNIDLKHSIFYSAITELLGCKLYSFDEVLSFLHQLKEKKPELFICINYSSFFDETKNITLDLIKAIKEALTLTDISLFEKSDIAHYFYFHKRARSSSLMNAIPDEDINKVNVEDYFLREIDNDNRAKSKRKVKIGIFIDELKATTIIQQNPVSSLVLFHTKYECSFYPGKPTQSTIDDYNRLINDNYSYIKSIYVGGLLSRVFNKKSFQTGITAGNESVKKVIDLIKNNIDFPSTPIYYEVVVKKPRTLFNKQLNIKKKEDQFVLDCTNIISSQKKSYNPLYDGMCASYFHSPHHRHHLRKLGFINMKGVILQDPTTKEHISSKNKTLIFNYEKEAMRLYQEKEKNEKMNLQMKSIANSLFSHNHTSSASVLSFLTQNKNNSEMLSIKKLPSLNLKGTYYHPKQLTIKGYNDIKVCSPIINTTARQSNETSDDSNKKKYKTDTSSLEKRQKEKKLMKFCLDKSNFVSMLDDIEHRLKKKPKEEDIALISDDENSSLSG